MREPTREAAAVCDRDMCWHTGKCQGLCSPSSPTREAAPSGWRPISEAPRDGRKIIALHKDGYETPMYANLEWVEGGEAARHYTAWRDKNPSSPTPTAEEVARIIAGFSEPLPGDPGSAHDHWEICLAKAARVLRLFQPEDAQVGRPVPPHGSGP